MTDEKTRRVKGRLQESKSKLNTLLDITNAINEHASKITLFNILKTVLNDELHIGKFTLFTYDSVSWHASLFKGVSEEECHGIDIEYVRSTYEDIGIITDDNHESIESFDIVIPVFHKSEPLAYMLLADFEGEKIEISPIIKHLRFIQTLINIIVVALENKRLNKERIKQIAIKKELELAQSMQSLLFPRKLPNSKKLCVKALYQPHSEVGGDYYDVIPLSNDRVAICIADVSGKGMPAALLMANFQANLRALMSVNDNIEDLIKACNSKIIESANYQKFITLFVAVFDPNEKTVTYLNAGHQPAILYKGDCVKMLNKGCTVLGMFDELPHLTSETISIDNNSKLICFTDGVAELEDRNGKQIEAEGIRNLVNGHQSLEAMNTALNEAIFELRNESGHEDDITLLTVEFLRQ